MSHRLSLPFYQSRISHLKKKTEKNVACNISASALIKYQNPMCTKLTAKDKKWKKKTNQHFMRTGQRAKKKRYKKKRVSFLLSVSRQSQLSMTSVETPAWNWIREDELGMELSKALRTILKLYFSSLCATYRVKFS